VTTVSTEKQKRKTAEERRLAREKQAEEIAHIWEKQILPDWKIVHRNPELRKLWWQGVPTSMRGKMWESAVGNPLSLSKGRALPKYVFLVRSLVIRFVPYMPCTGQAVARFRDPRVDRRRHPHDVTEPAPLSPRIRSDAWGTQGYALRVGSLTEGRGFGVCSWGGQDRGDVFVEHARAGRVPCDEESVREALYEVVFWWTWSKG